jgi:hypothetical protein
VAVEAHPTAGRLPNLLAGFLEIWHPIKGGVGLVVPGARVGGQMPFINVRLVDPKGRRYTVDIDSDLSIESIKAQLVQKLDMPADQRYTLQLIDSFSLSAGDEIHLVVSQEQGVMNLEQLNE